MDSFKDALFQIMGKIIVRLSEEDLGKLQNYDIEEHLKTAKAFTKISSCLKLTSNVSNLFPPKNKNDFPSSESKKEATNEDLNARYHQLQENTFEKLPSDRVMASTSFKQQNSSDDFSNESEAKMVGQPSSSSRFSKGNFSFRNLPEISNLDKVEQNYEPENLLYQPKECKSVIDNSSTNTSQVNVYQKISKDNTFVNKTEYSFNSPILNSSSKSTFKSDNLEEAFKSGTLSVSRAFTFKKCSSLTGSENSILSNASGSESPFLSTSGTPSISLHETPHIKPAPLKIKPQFIPPLMKIKNIVEIPQTSSGSSFFSKKMTLLKILP